MPAAAVIPAPLAYTKVVAVKTLVVGYQSDEAWPGCVYARALPMSLWLNSGSLVCPLTWDGPGPS